MSGNIRGRPDFLLLFLTILLVGSGLIMIFSASSHLALIQHDNPWYYVMKQGVFALIGLFVMFTFMGIPFTWWKRAAPILLLFSLLALTLVLIGGTSINGARRWFFLGAFNFQPAEFTKLSIIIYLSAVISKKGERIREFRKGLLPILAIVVIILLLVMKQPDFGTMLILLFIAATILLIGGTDLRHLVIFSMGLIPIIVYFAVSKSYRLQRLTSFLNPLDSPQGSGYQLIQSLYALGHGGLTGVGIGQSVQKLFYLPEAHTDFIFAVIGEELGFVGTSLLIFVFFLFIWRGFMAAISSYDPFGIMLGIGVIMMIFIQFLLNVGAVTGILPITGVTLPFISYGGSSLVLCLASTGILLSISRDNNRRRQEATRIQQNRGS